MRLVKLSTIGLVLPAVLALPADQDSGRGLHEPSRKRAILPEMGGLANVLNLVAVAGSAVTAAVVAGVGISAAKGKKDLLEYCLEETIPFDAFLTRERRLDECCNHLNLPKLPCRALAPWGYLAGTARTSGRQPSNPVHRRISEEGSNDAGSPDRFAAPVEQDEALEQQQQPSQPFSFPQMPQPVEDVALPVAGALAWGAHALQSNDMPGEQGWSDN